MSAALNLPASLLRESPRMFRHLVAFNTLPASYLHASRRGALGVPGADQIIWEQPRAHPFVSHWILQRLGMTDRWFFDPHCRVWPVALLPGPGMERLACHVGAVLAWPRLRRCVAREDVLVWKRGLTPAAYDFALAGAALLPTSISIEEPIDPETAIRMGYSWIAACLGETPDELRVRAELKLPADCRPAPVEQPGAWGLVHRVLRAMDPQWSSSFAKTPS